MKVFTSFLNSKKKSLTLLFVGFACALNGQNNSLYILNNNSKNSSPTIAQAHLLATTHVAQKGQDIVLAYSKKSKTGSHFGFNLILDGVILKNHFAVLHYINNKVIVQARQSDIQFDTYKYPNINWQKTINQLIANNNLENYRIKQQPIWFEFQNQLLPCIHIEAAYQHNYFELIVDQHGEILEKNDLNKYFSNQSTC